MPNVRSGGMEGWSLGMAIAMAENFVCMGIVTFAEAGSRTGKCRVSTRQTRHLAMET